MSEWTYILAASHSGSTLLGMLLGSHPGACTIGELKLTPSSLGDVSTYRCSCGELVRKCGFWVRIRRELADHGMTFSLEDARTDFRYVGSRYADRLLRPLVGRPVFEGMRTVALCVSSTWRRAHTCIEQRNVALADAVLAVHGKRVIVDSSKLASRLKHLVRIPAITMKVVRVIRDGRGVALTYMAPADFAAARDRDLRQRHRSDGMPMAAAARAWRRNNEEAQRVLATLDPSLAITVKYEELCTDPLGTLNRIFDHMGLGRVDAVPTFRDAGQHIIGNDMRFDRSNEIRLDERWRSVLTPEERDVFEREAGALNRAYGYV